MASKGKSSTLLNSVTSWNYVEENRDLFDDWVYFDRTMFDDIFNDEMKEYMRNNMEPSENELYRLEISREELEELSYLLYRGNVSAKDFDFPENKYSQLKVGDKVPFKGTMKSFSDNFHDFEHVVDVFTTGATMEFYLQKYPTLNVLIAPKGTPNFSLENYNEEMGQAETLVPSENWVVKNIETKNFKEVFTSDNSLHAQNMNGDKQVRLIYIEQDE